MGERMLRGEFCRPLADATRWPAVFAETVRLDGELGAKLAKPAVVKGGVAIGTALIAQGDEVLVERMREAAESFGGEVGISAWNGFATGALSVPKRCGPACREI